MKPDRSTPPPVKVYEKLHLPTLHRTVINPGTEINIIRTGSKPANNIAIVWNYGTACTEGGLAPTYVPTMLMQGTAKLSAEEIPDRIDFLGAFVGHNSAPQFTSVDCLSLNVFTPELIDLVADFMINPVFPEDRFMALKRKALAEFDLSRKRTTVIARERLAILMAGDDHPYFRPASREAIETLSVEQVRNAWREGVFGSAISLFAAGDISDTVLRSVEDFARAIHQDVIKATPAPVVSMKPEMPGTRYVEMKGASQSSVAIGIPAVQRCHPDYIPLRISVIALGGYFGSRLMQNIREDKGLTYGISASLAGQPEGSTINIQADCDPAYVTRVIDEIQTEMRRMADEPLPIAEFERLRSYYMTTVAATLESFKSVCDHYRSALTIGFPDNYFEAQQDWLQTITPDIIRTMAQIYFDPERAITVVAGPGK